jgi:DNA-binding NarL/FixJ family response regulator
MKILLADKEPNIRYGLSALLEELPEFDVAAEADNTSDFYSALRYICPDLVLMSIQFPEIAVGDFIQNIKRNYPDTKILILATNADQKQLVLSAGADGFVSKSDKPEYLIMAIHEIRKNKKRLVT